MSDELLKKAQEIEDKLKRLTENRPAPQAAAPVVPRQRGPSVVVNAYSAGDEDATRAKALGDKLLKMMAGPVKKQPTDQELFGHLVPTEEQIRAAEAKWGSGINDFFTEVQKPVEQVQKHDVGRRGPIREEDLTEEEQRIRKIGVDPRLLEDK